MTYICLRRIIAHILSILKFKSAQVISSTASSWKTAGNLFAMKKASSNGRGFRIFKNFSSKTVTISLGLGGHLMSTVA